MSTAAAQIQTLQDAVDGLKREIGTYRQGLQAEFDRLNYEAEMQKKLSRYARRTWFEVIAYVFLVGLLVSDIARAYAHTRWWGLLFWTTRHGQGDALEWVCRAIGFVWEVSLLFVMGRRSQVPDWMFERVPYAEEQRLHNRRAGDR